MRISLSLSHGHTIHNQKNKKTKKKSKQKKIVGGIEIYCHTYMLIVGQAHFVQTSKHKKIYAQ